VLGTITRALLLALLLACGWCMAEQPAYQAFASEPGQATIIITRLGGLLYAGVPASVDINGSRVADLGPGQFYSGAVRPGQLIVTVSAGSAPGQSVYRFNVEPGKSYRFVVAPHSNNTVAGTASGSLGKAAEGGGPFEILRAGN
jgi:hypothetical protein